MLYKQQNDPFYKIKEEGKQCFNDWCERAKEKKR